MVTTLDDLAVVLRSKNAGPFYFTIDVFLPDLETYRRAAAPGFLTPEVVAKAYGVGTDEVFGIFRLESALAIKVTIRKRVLADDPANTDVIASQQHLPLAWLPVPELADSSV
jgi:hypothetical protein